jgi:lysophospholipase L1-like esterase
MQRLPGVTVQVINKGKGGEDAPEELARLNRDVLAEHPDLVIWQVGTNAVLRRDDLANDAASIRRGVAMLKSAGVDVVLMDLQYAPGVIARPAYAEMEKVIAKAAADSEVGLFRRFDIMQYWEAAIPADRGQMIGPDGLHMTDRGYRCLASDIAEAVAERWRTYHRSGPGQRSLAGVHAAKAVDPGSLLVP